MGKDEETEITVECHAAQAPLPRRVRAGALRVGIGYLFFIQHWTLDVRCWTFIFQYNL
jgi:hypothetical protein